MLLVLGKSQSWKHVQNDQVYFKIILTCYIWTICTHQGKSFLAKWWKLMRKNIGDLLATYLLLFFFSVRERAVFYKSCNLICSECGQYSPQPARSQWAVLFATIYKVLFTSLCLVYQYRYPRPRAQFFPIRTSRLVNNIYILVGKCFRFCLNFNRNWPLYWMS